MEVEVEKQQPSAQAITCGPENVAAFNARLRAELPEFHEFAKALHDQGMIDGLRGARIGPVGSLPDDGVPMTPLTIETERRILDRDWKRGRAQR
jgi:hypothetical protein